MLKNKFEFSEYKDICELCSHRDYKYIGISLYCKKCKFIHDNITGDKLLLELEIIIYNKKNGKS